ncbi:MAG: DNA repair protein RecN, partial [Lachnospiraceae bacterium]|nr:DNA repair protein RecN [Lachnospiraceae bacterium]
KADKISSLRKKATASFNASIEESLKDLNFNQSRFEVNISDTADYTNMGKDNVKFTISVNPGEALKALESVSSGGELSRIMLALKTVSASSDEVKTMIFDEIDAGISGTTAWQVAKKLALLSKSHQVICITHLQQIASMADAHFKIEKEVTDDERTSTYINLLDKDGEIAEISRMLGDEQASDTFKDNALEIKKRALDYKKTI